MNFQKAVNSLSCMEFHEHLLNISNKLGGYGNHLNDSTFLIGEDAIDTLKEIKTYLQMEDESYKRPCFELLSSWKIVNRKILPIFLMGNKEISLLCIEILVPLTWPINKEFIHHYQPYLISLKEAFVQKYIFKKVVKLLKEYENTAEK